MYKICIVIGILLCMSLSNKGLAQGPPITADKPIMLGGKTKLIKTLSEFRKTEQGDYLSLPVMFHYLPSSNSLIGLHIPFVNYALNGENGSNNTIGDVAILGKYQFYRKDQMGKTFRVVAKTLQTLPTGEKLGADGISTGTYQSYQGIVAGYESIKYGISNELGYNIVPNESNDELRYKLGFGLPLKKPVYPVNQVNLYFEYQNSWFTERHDFLMLFAQGIQYAKGRLTVEGAIQFPLVQNLPENLKREYSIFFGTRYIL